MGQCTALYRRSTSRPPRSIVELASDALWLLTPDGERQRLSLNRRHTYTTGDARCRQRFVRHLTLGVTEGVAHLITPPGEGAIAPRALCLPGVPADVAILEVAEWEAVFDWLHGRCRLSGRTVRELARLACIATPQFAIAIGEWVAHVAAEMTWENRGPMRGGVDLSFTLRPLEEAARRSPRAHDALVAAYSRLTG